MQKQTLLLRWFSMASVYWLPACKTSRCRTKFLYVQGQGPSEHLGNALFEVRVLHFPARMKLSQAPQSVHRVASPVEEVEEKDGLKKQVSDHTVGWTGQRQICWAQTCTTFVGWSPPRSHHCLLREMQLNRNMERPFCKTSLKFSACSYFPWECPKRSFWMQTTRKK